MTTDGETREPATGGAFGAENRARLLDEYFQGEEAPTISTAWRHVYRLLLWTDQTTGLAHCYESDKCQPGKPWYGRSLAFHSWLAASLGVPPPDVAGHIDWLFRKATLQLAVEALRAEERLREAAVVQRQRYQGSELPEPGDDPELKAIIRDALSPYLSSEPNPETWTALIARIRRYLGTENKRKNLLGEGFEDVIARTLQLVPECGPLAVQTRRLLHDLPGFARNRAGEKDNKVDVAIMHGDRRILVSAKWSIRADREKQFAADFDDYVNAESSRHPFDYVLVTNEFDPARLMRACEDVVTNTFMFRHVVHINTEALAATYGESPSDTQRKVLAHIESGRLIGLEEWIIQLTR